jgi:hypothetical protein
MKCRIASRSIMLRTWNAFRTSRRSTGAICRPRVLEGRPAPARRAALVPGRYDSVRDHEELSFHDPEQRERLGARDESRRQREGVARTGR